MKVVAELWRYRWFALGVAFLGVNTWGVVRTTRPGIPMGAVAVQRVTPEPGSDLAAQQVLTFRFTSPMADEETVGRSSAAGPLAISPETPGLFLWTDARTLQFAPDRGWVACTRFQVRLLDGLTSLEGEPVVGDRTWSFSTAPLSVVRMDQTAVEDKVAVVRLELSAPVSARAVRDHLTAQDGRAREVEARVDGDAVSATHLARVPISSDPVRLRLAAGLPPHTGDRPLASDRDLSLNLSGRVHLQVVRPFTPDFEPPHLELQFNQPMDPRVVRSFLEVTPGEGLRVEPSPSGLASRIRVSSPAFRPGAVARVAIEAGLPGGAHSRPLADRIERQVQFPDRRPRVALRTTGRYLSPESPLVLPVATSRIASFAVRVDRVYDNNLVPFAHDQTGGWHYRPSDRWVSRRVASFTVPVAAGPDRDVPLDLRPYLPDPPDGAYQVTVSLPDGSQSARHLMVVSDLGITARAWTGGMLVWVNSLADATPAAACEVVVMSHTNQELARGRTDGDGLAWLDLPADDAAGRPFLITAEAASRRGFLLLGDTGVQPRGETGGRPHARHPYEAFVHTDRGIARPGETARVRAILRDPDLGTPDPFPVRLRIRRPDGRVFRQEGATLSAVGAAAWDFAIPEDAPTGSYSLEITPPGSDIVYGFGRIAVEEYVPPQIRVEATAGAGRVGPGEPVVVDVRAEHLFGAPASGLPASARAEIRPVPFAPAGWEGFRFGDDRQAMPPRFVEVGRGALDADGRGRFRASVPAGTRPPAALRVLVGVSVTEPNGRASTAFAGQDVDIVPYYLGVRAGSGSLTVGSSRTFEVAAVARGGSAHDPGRALPAVVERITRSHLLRRSGGQDRYHWHSEEIATPVSETELQFSDGRAAWTHTPAERGDYRLVVRDEAAGVVTSHRFWVSGPGETRSAFGHTEPDRVTLRLDRERYRAGDTATLEVEAPFAGSLLLTLETDRVLEARRIDMTGPAATLEIPVTADMAPNLFCAVTVIRRTGFGPEGVQVRSSGVTRLEVEQPQRVLRVANHAPGALAPGDTLALPVQVHDLAGEPVSGAEVTVAAVDEGICLLTNFTTPDPAGFFLGPRRLGTAWYDLYRQLMPLWDGVLTDDASHTAGDGAGSLGRRLSPIQARRFRPTVLWSGVRTTDAEGRAVVELDVPEFTGTLRVMTVAVSRDAFGRSHPEDAVVVRRPLTARWSLPRFLAPDDRCDVGVQLYADESFEGEARVRIEVDGPLAIRGEPRGTRELAPGGRAGLGFALTAGSTPGVATVTLHVEAGGMAWSETEEIAVRPAAALTTVSGVLAVDAGEEKTFVPGRAWVPGTLAGTIRVSGLPALELAPGLSYLLRYPYGCLEQTVSSAFPLLYLADLAAEVAPDTLGAEEATPFVDSAIRRVMGMQRHDGGFGWWSATEGAWPWGSAYAAHFLAEARRAGYEVPDDRMAAADRFLAALLARPPREGTDIVSALWREDMSARAYAAYILALRGRPDAGWMARLAELTPHLPRSAAIHTVAALAATSDRRAALDLLGQIGPPGPPSPRRAADSDSLASPARDDALLLSAWVELDPQHEHVPVLISRLRQARAQGRWYTTQENAMALMALGKVARHIRTADPAFAATLAGPDGSEHEAGHNTPLAVRLAADTPEGGWTLRNRGPSRAYVYWRAEGVPADGGSVEADHGIAARRELLDIQGRPIGDRPLTQGELVVVRITVDPLGHQRDHVAIDDLLPAGLEVENPRLATSALVPWLRQQGLQIPRHFEVRDDRVLYFSPRIGGRTTYAYAARAVTPGTYVWPAVEAHCMYDPDIRSAHGRGRLVVRGEK